MAQVITEELDDGLLSESILRIGRLARRSLLTPRGLLVPSRATIKAQLLSVRAPLSTP